MTGAPLLAALPGALAGFVALPSLALTLTLLLSLPLTLALTLSAPGDWNRFAAHTAADHHFAIHRAGALSLSAGLLPFALLVSLPLTALALPPPRSLAETRHLLESLFAALTLLAHELSELL